MTTFTIKKAKGLEGRSFDTIQDAIYFLTLHGLKPKKDVVDDDPEWTKETLKNKKVHEESKKNMKEVNIQTLKI